MTLHVHYIKKLRSSNLLSWSSSNCLDNTQQTKTQQILI